MSGITVQWKIFRVICIIQLVLVALQIMLSVSGIFFGGSIVYPVIESIVYCLVLLFVYQGLSLLNYNYPDTPLTTRQKRQFNWMFLLNFLLIAFLFARVINTWWVVPFLWESTGVNFYNSISLLTPFLIAFIIFILHLLFLSGIFRLRRIIYQNTVDTWYRQFGEGGQE